MGYPQNFTAVTVNSTNILVLWDPVFPEEQNGDILTYEVEINQTMFTDVSRSEMRETSGPELMMLLLDNLEEFVNYSLRVRAQNSEGAGPFSPAVFSTTDQDGKGFVCAILTHQLCIHYHAHRASFPSSRRKIYRIVVH